MSTGKRKRFIRLRKWVKRILLGLGLLIALLLVSGFIYQTAASAMDAKRYPPLGRMVDVGGHHLHLYCQGAGTPTVILEAGLGASMMSWALIQPEVSKTTRTCAYDRAGFGWSEDGPEPRDSRTIVRELKKLLTNAEISPPYVFVGHSAGGIHSRLYAHTHPDEVAGMVLVDSSHEEQEARFPREVAEQQAMGIKLMKVMGVLAHFGVFRLISSPWDGLPENIRYAALAISNQTRNSRSAGQEMDAIEASSAQMAQVKSLGDIPLVVLTQGKSYTPDELPPGMTMDLVNKVRAVHLELQKELTQQSTKGRHIIAEKSGHAIQFDEPELVIKAINDVVGEVRAD